MNEVLWYVNEIPHYVVRDVLVGETRMLPRYRGYGCGRATVTKFPDRTRNRVTRFGNTAGKPVPVLNPKWKWFRGLRTA
jgi:hypothetical protein